MNGVIFVSRNGFHLNRVLKRNGFLSMLHLSTVTAMNTLKTKGLRREEVLMEFLRGYNHDGMERVFFATMPLSDTKEDEKEDF